MRTQQHVWAFRHKMYGRKLAMSEEARRATDREVLEYLNTVSGRATPAFWRAPGSRVKFRVFAIEALSRGLIDEPPPFRPS